jgi:hypothetical protein
MDKRPKLTWDSGQKVADKLIDVDRIMLDITNNTPAIFGTPTGKTIIQVGLDNGTLRAKEVIARTGAEGSADIRDTAEGVVDTDMHDKMAWVQSMMDNSGSTSAALAIGHASGFKVMVAGKFIKPPIRALKKGMGIVKIIVISAGKGVNASYDFQITLDSGVTITDLPSNVIAELTVGSLTTFIKTGFRYRTITREGTTAWSYWCYCAPE